MLGSIEQFLAEVHQNKRASGALPSTERRCFPTVEVVHQTTPVGDPIP